MSPIAPKEFRNGDILVEVDKGTKSSKLFKTTKLSLSIDNVISIYVSLYYSLNTKRSHWMSMKNYTDKEIPEGLKDEGIINLDRITVFRDGLGSKQEFLY